MTQRYEIPEKILKDYFILHDGIKDASAFYPLEVFNRETFDTESELGVFTKKSFHLYIGLCLGLFLSSLYFFFNTIEQIQLAPQSYDSLTQKPKAEELLRRSTLRLNALISALFFISAGYCSVKALKARNGFKESEKSRLLKGAHHPGIAKLVYEALEIIVAHRIPIHTEYNKLVHDFPINSISGTRKNVMLVLLGDETHRQSLWKDGHVPKGPILVHKKYSDKVLGALAQSIRNFDEMTKDERDPRYLVTALLNQKHMEDCLAVMSSDGFWKEKRKSKKRRIILSLTEVLLKNWDIWENFRNNITGNFTKATYKDSEFHDFVEELLENSGATKTEIIDILSGEDRTSREFFRSLKAIKEQDLVARDTQVK